jgi:hypothetical protein
MMNMSTTHSKTPKLESNNEDNKDWLDVLVAKPIHRWMIINYL